MSSIYYWKELLPSDWKVVPLKAVASYSVSSVDKVVKEEELPVELCNYTDVYKNDFITNDLEFMKGSATEEEILKYKVEIGDVIITKDSESWDDIAIPALVKETKSNLVCGYHLSIIKAYEDKILPAYLFYCLQSKDIRIQLELASTGVTRYGLPKDEIGRASLPLPDIDLQGIISNYIDNELAEIAELIRAKNSLLQILSEKRQAVITKAVTKGIDPKIKLKDSGIDWLGEIPEHWTVKKLKYVVSKIDEVVDQADFIIAVENIESETGKLISSEKENFYEGNLFKFQIGDVIFNKLRPYLAKVYLAVKEGACVGELLILRGNQEILPEFLFFRMLSKEFISQVNSSTVGAKMPRANWDDFIKHIKVGLPPIEEQIEIANFIYAEQKAIQRIYDVTTKSIELLKERKASLITSAVTGKLKIADENTRTKY